MSVTFFFLFEYDDTGKRFSQWKSGIQVMLHRLLSWMQESNMDLILGTWKYP